MTARYALCRIDLCDDGKGGHWEDLPLKLLDLPDAEHVHLTRLPDGTWKADPMRLAGVLDAGHYLEPHNVGDQGPLPTDVLVWVDGEAS